MYGMIFAELKKYVDAKLSFQLWPALLSESGHHYKTYMNCHEYPDAELETLLTAVATCTGTPAADILETFGQYLAPDLLAMYPCLILPGWRTLDVLEHAEWLLHGTVRLRNPGARPPYLQITRPHRAEVRIRYTSSRRLCALAKGIIGGIALHYNEAIRISEPYCMHDGATACLLVVQRNAG